MQTASGRGVGMGGPEKKRSGSESAMSTESRVRDSNPAASLASRKQVERVTGMLQNRQECGD